MPIDNSLNTSLALGLLGVVLLVLLGVGIAILAGLFQARSLIRREFTAYFLSPIAYVVLAAFLLVTGYRFSLTLEQLTTSGPRGVEYPMQFLFSFLPRSERFTIAELLSGMAFWLVYLLIPPLLTMRLFAEERATGTLELLMTAPLRDWQVVLGKYVACLAFYVLIWVPTLVYLPILVDMRAPVWDLSAWTPFSITMVAGLAAMVAALVLALLPGGKNSRLVSLGLLLAGAVAAAIGGWWHYQRETVHLVDVPTGIDPFPVVSAYLGLILAGAMFLALSLLVSSLVRSQMVAGLVSLLLCLAFVAVGFARPDSATDSPLYRGLFFVSVPLHYHRDFSRGIIDTRHLVLYLSVAVFSLFLTVRSLESRRWQ